jgi:hypothetical protein
MWVLKKQSPFPPNCQEERGICQIGLIPFAAAGSVSANALFSGLGLVDGSSITFSSEPPSSMPSKRILPSSCLCPESYYP